MIKISPALFTRLVGCVSLHIQVALVIVVKLFDNYAPKVKGIFTDPEENNCFSIISQVIIRANAFCFFFSPETSNIARRPF